MTKEEEEKFLTERVNGMKNLLPQSPDEFEDQVAELTWQWGRNLLPYVDPQRHDLASYKRRTILKQTDFYQKMRLFKPLAMKHPTMMKRLNIREYGHIENKNWEINTPWIKNEETIAGFTYEDFVQETAGNTFENWEMPQVDDIISGKVVGLNEDGAFVEIGAKTWAFIPTKLCSLAPVALASEVFSMGEEIEAKVVSTSTTSMIPGDPSANQMLLSVVELQSESAWNEIEAILRAEEGTEPILEVMVRQLKPFGAIVQTKSGLEGVVPNAYLADKVGDTSIVGRPLAVEIQSAKRELAGVQAFRPTDFALVFNHRNVATKELAKGCEEGEVLDAKVVEVNEGRLDVSVDGIRCSIRKVDISSGTYNIPDIFEVGEDIKVYVLSKNEKSGEVRLSTRALEYKKQALVINKARVFERAEETAAKYLKRANKAKAAKESELRAAFSDSIGGKGGNMADIMGDSDDDESVGF